MKAVVETILILLVASVHSDPDNPNILGAFTAKGQTDVPISLAIRNTARNYIKVDDIMIPKKKRNNVTNHIENVIADPSYRWPRGVVPFVIHSSLDEQINLIYGAMNEYITKTCIQFIPRTNETNYIWLWKGTGCSSFIGMQGDGYQLVSLGSGCEYHGTVVHELGHAIAFYHEQSRSDRDGSVQVFIENVEGGKEHNFDKVSPNENILYTSYDVASIMQYGEYAFSKQPGILKTMVAKNGYKLQEPYDKAGLTDADVYKVNSAYPCD